MNKQNLKALVNHSHSLSKVWKYPRNFIYLDPLWNKPIIGNNFYVVMFDSLPEGFEVLHEPFFFRESLSEFFNYAYHFRPATAAQVRVDLRQPGNDVLQVGDRFLNLKMVYRIARVIGLHTIGIPDNKNHAIRLIGDEGQAFIMPVDPTRKGITKPPKVVIE